MDVTLIAVTLLSLTIAMVMSTIVWRMVREERRRSAARVAALAACLREESTPPERQPAVSSAAMRTVRPNEAGANMEPPWDQIARAERTPASLDDAVSRGRPMSDHSSAAELFATTQAPSPVVRRLAVAVLLGVFVMATAITAALLARSPKRASHAAVTTAPSTVVELVELKHERKGDVLTVSGVIRNAAGGPEIDALTAVVFLFDQTGAVQTSARAPIDQQRLGPGEESPFTISVPAAGQTIARYRVSFRTDHGVVPHVDRRGSPALGSVAQRRT